MEPVLFSAWQLHIIQWHDLAPNSSVFSVSQFPFALTPDVHCHSVTQPSYVFFC